MERMKERKGARDKLRQCVRGAGQDLASAGVEWKTRRPLGIRVVDTFKTITRKEIIAILENYEVLEQKTWCRSEQRRSHRLATTTEMRRCHLGFSIVKVADTGVWLIWTRTPGIFGAQFSTFSFSTRFILIWFLRLAKSFRRNMNYIGVDNRTTEPDASLPDGTVLCFNFFKMHNGIYEFIYILGVCEE